MQVPRSRRLSNLALYVALILAAWLLPMPASEAAISWDGGGNSNWWFDPLNWAREMPSPPCPCLPPAKDDGDSVTFTDVQINIGSNSTWNKTGEGIVFDPENDPFYEDAFENYPTGSPIEPFVGSDYGREHLYRLYLSRNTTNSNLITIKSGDMAISSTTIIGRSGSTGTEPNLGRVDQLGGRVRLPSTAMEIGNAEASGWGNGTWDYRGGILEVSLVGGGGLRLAHGRDADGAGGSARFIMHNPGDGGHVRVREYENVSFRGVNDGDHTNLDPDGTTRGVATSEFHFENVATRPIQVVSHLTLNNGLDSNTLGVMSTRLELVLDEAPPVDDAGVPVDIGLFDVDFDLGFGSNGGTVRGFGDIDGDDLPDAVFANHDGTVFFHEGDTVSAGFGMTQYNWAISYTGNITWSDADDSVLSSIEGVGTGNDVVLIGLSSEAVGLVGDYNRNGIVDAADYTVWRDALGTVTELENDLLGETVGQAQYNQWVANFGNTMEQFAVPEPGSFFFVISMTAVLISPVRRMGKQRSAGKRRSVTFCLLIGLLMIPMMSTDVLADPTLTVSDLGLNVSSNREWSVEVAPEFELFTPTVEGMGGSLQVELAFEVTGSSLVGATKNGEVWPLDSIGNNPFTGGHTFAIQTDSVEGTVYASLGSGILTSGSSVEVFTIETLGAETTTLKWGGHTLLPGSPFQYVGSRISQAGINFDGFQGSLSSGAGGVTGDFNADGSFDCLDIDGLMAEIVSVSNDVGFDLNSDGVVDLVDRDAWLAEAGTANGLVEAYLPGDATLDGTVNASDLNLVGLSWLGDHSEWCLGNFDAEGVINAGDLNLLGLNWQRSVPSAATANSVVVPEPGTAMLLALGLVALTWVGSRKLALSSLNS